MKTAIEMDMVNRHNVSVMKTGDGKWKAERTIYNGDDTPTFERIVEPESNRDNVVRKARSWVFDFEWEMAHRQLANRLSAKYAREHRR